MYESYFQRLQVQQAHMHREMMLRASQHQAAAGAEGPSGSVGGTSLGNSSHQNSRRESQILAAVAALTSDVHANATTLALPSSPPSLPASTIVSNAGAASSSGQEPGGLRNMAHSSRSPRELPVGSVCITSVPSRA